MIAHDDLRLSLGAYALGTLEPADQRLVEAHLAGCPDCLAELAELESVVPVLSGLSHDDLVAPTPSPDLFARITNAVDSAEDPHRAAGRSRRWLVAVAASVVLLAGAGTAVGVVLSHTSHPSASFSASSNGIRLSGTATDTSAGTRFVLTAKGLRSHELCHLVATAADNSRHDAGTWSASYEGKAQVVEVSDVPRSELRSLTLYGNGRKLLDVNV